MNNHLSIQIDGKFVALAGDTSIDIEDVNPYLNDSEETWSWSFNLPIDGNRELFGNVDTIESDNRLVEIENKPMTVFVDGIAFRSGKVATSEDQEIVDTISVSMSSNAKSLADYISDLQCKDIPVRDKIKIGEMIGNVSCAFSGSIKLETKKSGKTGFLTWSSEKRKTDLGTNNGDLEIELPALGFSVPAECKEDSNHFSDGANSSDGKSEGKNPTYLQKFINVTEAYPISKFCNARVCYMHYKLGENNKSSDIVDNSSEYNNINKRYNPYFVLDAERPSSGICFYVLYFLDCLFSYLSDYGVSYDNSELKKVDDLCRLVFFTTHCKYNLERKYDIDIRDPKTGVVIERVFDYNTLKDVNRWLSTHNTGGKLSVDWEKTKDIDGLEYDGVYYRVGDELPDGTELKYAHFKISDVDVDFRANIMNMYANEQNFPDETVSSIIESLWAAFGIRFYLDQETMLCKPFFIRDLLRDVHDPIVLKGELYEIHKMSEKITGFRMRYSAESDDKEKNANIVNGVRDYDTNFDYKDYRNLNSSLTYKEIVKKGSVSDMHLYVDKTTGNKYRVKVNGEAETVDEYHPVIFEVGQFTGVDIGDCSDENEDFVEEVSIGFTPVVFNDVNGRNEKNAGNVTEDCEKFVPDQPGTSGNIGAVNVDAKQQVLAAFVNEDMWHEYCERKVKTAFGTSYADFYLVETCHTKESFDPSGSDDGGSPLQTYDWGTSMAIMRGGGSDAYIQKYDYDYDGFGNSKWRTVAGMYGMSSDSIDCWGNVYDYNGTEDGIGDGERISLKIRAYINDPESGNILCNHEVANRGLFDTFMSEYAHFLLNRKKVQIRFNCRISELMNIQWNKRYKIGEYVGWINKISTHITAENGIESVTIEMYIL